MNAGAVVAAIAMSLFTGGILVVGYVIRRLFSAAVTRWLARRDAKRAEQVSHVIKRRSSASTPAMPPR
jgi:hypothetical protein